MIAITLRTVETKENAIMTSYSVDYNGNTIKIKGKYGFQNKQEAKTSILIWFKELSMKQRREVFLLLKKHHGYLVNGEFCPIVPENIRELESLVKFDKKKQTIDVFLISTYAVFLTSLTLLFPKTLIGLHLFLFLLSTFIIAKNGDKINLSLAMKEAFIHTFKLPYMLYYALFLVCSLYCKVGLNFFLEKVGKQKVAL